MPELQWIDQAFGPRPLLQVEVQVLCSAAMLLSGVSGTKVEIAPTSSIALVPRNSKRNEPFPLFLGPGFGIGNRVGSEHKEEDRQVTHQ